MQIRRFIVIGALLGLAIGIVVSFMFPDLLLFAAEFNSANNAQLGLPNYTPKSGSVLNSLMTSSMFFGIMGGFLGFIAFKLLRVIQVKHSQ